MKRTKRRANSNAPLLSKHTPGSIAMLLGSSAIIFACISFTLVEIHLYRKTRLAAQYCTEFSEPCLTRLIEITSWQSPFDNTWQKAGRLALVGLQTADLNSEKRVELLWSLRSAVYGSRNFLRPERPGTKSALLEEIERSGVQMEAFPLSRAGAEDLHFQWQVAGQLFFWSWLAFVFLAIWRGMNKQGSIHLVKFSVYLTLGLASFAFWLVCLSFA